MDHTTGQRTLVEYRIRVTDLLGHELTQATIEAAEFGGQAKARVVALKAAAAMAAGTKNIRVVVWGLKMQASYTTSWRAYEAINKEGEVVAPWLDQSDYLAS